MIKRIMLLIVALIISVNVGYAQFSDSCENVPCPGPPLFWFTWEEAETGCVMMKINDVGDYCFVKVCYCFHWDFYFEDPQIYIRKLVFCDTTEDCLKGKEFKPDIFKTEFIKEILRCNVHALTLTPCPTYSEVEIQLYTAPCYYTFKPDNMMPMMAPCYYDGYCLQKYKYCWDFTNSEPEVIKDGPPVPYGWYEDCEEIYMPGDLIQGCMPWCTYEE